MIIVLCSPYPKVGKDEVYKIISKHLNNVERVAFADELKDVCYHLGYIDELKTVDDRHRQLLIDVGNVARKFDKDVWVYKASEEIDKYITFGKIVVITDNRYKNEEEYLRRKYNNVLVVGIESNNLGQKEFANDISQIDYKDIKKDYIIHNNGTLEDLEKSVLTILKSEGFHV